MADVTLLPWTTYSDDRPTKVGVYEWRVPSVTVSGLVIIVAAHMRKRGAGYEDVISPSFDYWNGYRVFVPVGLQWREPVGDYATLDKYDSRIVGIEGLDVSPCVYCGKTPDIKGSQDTGRGIVIGPAPQDLNSWRLSCCSWGTTPFGNDPRALEAMRRKATSPALTPKQAAADVMAKALEEMLREKADYMRRNHLGNPEHETVSQQATAALAAYNALAKAGQP